MSAQRKYRYSILRFQPSLQDERKEPLAVVVESEWSTGSKTLLIIGRHLPEENLKGLSDLARKYLEGLPDRLMEQMKEAISASRGDDVIGYLAHQNIWNLFFSEPSEQRVKQPIFMFATQLFAEHVIGIEVVPAGSAQGPQEELKEEIFLEQLPITPEELVEA